MRKKIFIALRMAGIAGQDKLSGIFRFLGESPKWDITLIRTAAEFTPDSVRTALADRYDGFIVSIPSTEPSAAILADTTIPTVVMDIHDHKLSARRRNIAFVRNSSDEIGRAAANHLISMGICRSYAFIHNPSVMQWSVDRCRSFSETLRDNGCWCHVLASPEELRSLERPVGVFTANDDCGYSTIEYCRTHRLRIPEDVAVLGTNNDTLICENCHPRLSSVQPDFEQEGFLAAQTLSKMMSAHTTRATPITIRVGVKQIVRRESTAEISHSGKLVQRALVYIRRNACKGICVDDVAHHLKVSRRLADLRFRQLQGTSIGETIIRLRLEEVKRLLRSTKEPIETISAKCGYENVNYLKNLFRRRFAMSMRQFRGMT